MGAVRLVKKRVTPTGAIRQAVFARACGECEACGVYIDEEIGRLDHFFGRAKVAEAVSNCLALCQACDHEKTTSKPSAVWWLTRFIEIASRHGYAAEIERAEARLLALVAKGF